MITKHLHSFSLSEHGCRSSPEQIGLDLSKFLACIDEIAVSCLWLRATLSLLLALSHSYWRPMRTLALIFLSYIPD
jgi:hypothetical protein